MNNAYTTNHAAVAEMAATLEISTAEALAFIQHHNRLAKANIARARAIGRAIGVRVSAYPERAVFGYSGLLPDGPPSATLVYASGRLFGDPALVAAIKAAL